MGPKVSIVTSSHNQAASIARTIESVRVQDYPNVEHIIVDGLSTDDTPEVLAGYPHLRVIRTPHRGQTHAINEGFRIAAGDILGLVNPNDTLEAGAVAAVAHAIDPAAGRHVVTGRCRVMDDHHRFFGLELSGAPVCQRRVLEIWKGHGPPQQSTFWTRAMWERHGPMNVDEPATSGYELFCRFTRDAAFHELDCVLSNTRLCASSEGSLAVGSEVLEHAIAVSRRYWGTPLSGSYWAIYASYLRYRLNRRVRAAALLRTGRHDVRAGRPFSAAVRIVGGVLLAPDVVADIAIVPVMRPVLARAAHRSGFRDRAAPAQVVSHSSATSLYSDGWAGPSLVVIRHADRTHTALALSAALPPGAPDTPLEIEAFVDGRSLGVQAAGVGPNFELVWPIPDLAPGSHDVRLSANGFVVPYVQFGTADHRQLSFRVAALDFVEA